MELCRHQLLHRDTRVVRVAVPKQLGKHEPKLRSSPCDIAWNLKTAHRTAHRSRSAVWRPGAVSAWQRTILPGRCYRGPMSCWLGASGPSWRTDGSRPHNARDAMRPRGRPAGKQGQRAAGAWLQRRSLVRCAVAACASAAQKDCCTPGPARTLPATFRSGNGCIQHHARRQAGLKAACVQHL